MMPADLTAIAREIAESLVGSAVPFMQNMHEENVRRIRSILAKHWPAPALTLVRRPVERVSTLVVPETGVYAYRKQDQTGYRAEPFYDGVQLSESITAIRRIDTDAPTTWIPRTTVETPRAWKTSDVPAAHLAYQKPHSSHWYTLDAACLNVGAMVGALNDNNATRFVVLPAEAL